MLKKYFVNGPPPKLNGLFPMKIHLYKDLSLYKCTLVCIFLVKHFVSTITTSGQVVIMMTIYNITLLVLKMCEETLLPYFLEI